MIKMQYSPATISKVAVCIPEWGIFIQAGKAIFLTSGKKPFLLQTIVIKF
jgi:hypothetical protein